MVTGILVTISMLWNGVRTLNQFLQKLTTLKTVQIYATWSWQFPSKVSTLSTVVHKMAVSLDQSTQKKPEVHIPRSTQCITVRVFTYISSFFFLPSFGAVNRSHTSRIVSGIVICFSFLLGLHLVGGFNPSEKYEWNWILSPTRGENRKYLKPPPSHAVTAQNFYKQAYTNLGNPERMFPTHQKWVRTTIFSATSTLNPCVQSFQECYTNGSYIGL